MNAEEYAAYRDVSKMTVSRWCREGKIEALKVGKEWQIDPAVADAMLPETQDSRQPNRASASPDSLLAKRPKVLLKDPKDPLPDLPKTDAKKTAKIDVVHPGSKGPTLAEAQRAKAVYQAERERIALMKDKDEVVLVADVKTMASSLARQVRDLLLIIPNRNAAKLAAISDPEQVQSLLELEIENALKGLKNA